MIKISSDRNWIDIGRSTNCGSDGLPEMQLNIYPGMYLTEAKRQLDEVYYWYLEQKNEAELRKQNPTLQNAWEQYQIIKALVKEENAGTR